MKREMLLIPRRFTTRAICVVLSILLIFSAGGLLLRTSYIYSKADSLFESSSVLRQSERKSSVTTNSISKRSEDGYEVVKPKIIDATDEDSLYDSLISQRRGGSSVNKNTPERTKAKDKSVKAKKDPARKIKCKINGKKLIGCLYNSKDVYMPFKFIEEYFEVFGSRSDDPLVFDFQHSTADIKLPGPEPYHVSGSFLFFNEYVVEMRSRVLAVSAKHGVPVSTQWDPAGYYYPIQIVQYGLSHYSQYYKGGQNTERPTILEDGTMRLSEWEHSSDVILQSVTEPDNNQAVYFDTTLTDSAASLIVDISDVSCCISFDVKFNTTSNSSVSLLLEIEEGDGQDGGYYVITYTQGQFWMKRGADDLQYGLGNCTGDWCRLHRDIKIDLLKFLSSGKEWNLIAKNIKSFSKLEVKGRGLIDNIVVSKTCHTGHFLDASEWILANQDSKGGWPVPVQRVVTSKRLTLQPGWYSAMAQGHAISILVRAFLYTKQDRFLAAAARSLPLYNTSTELGGIRARFLNLYDWYEEYPTTPPLFVLNGFIYSLFGLYDLASLSDLEIKGHEEARATAMLLYKSGIKSLEKLLPFYDSGTGTFYDLRHYTNPGMEPNRARWDYHSVHIAQLYYLSDIENSTLFRTVADRWLGYTEGIRANHN